MIKGRAVVAITVCAAFLSGCIADSRGEIADAVHEQASFTLAEVVDKPVKEAYVFCQYTNPEDGVARGFDEGDFFGVRNNPQAWETSTGIGLLFEDGTKPRVEWFDATDINACPESSDPLRQLDPDQTITVRDIPMDFVGVEDKVMVKTLSYE